VTITTGQPDPSARAAEMRDWLLDGLDLVVEAAHRAGVELAIECEPGQFIERSADLKVLLDEVGDPRLGANLDIGHAVCLGEDPAESVRLLAPHLKHLHLEDIKGRRHWHLIPGDGDIDFASVARALAEVGYGRAAAVELYTYKDEPDGAARAAFAALAPLFGPRQAG
jgi:sugar phosphate isomerase/epimerase